jgi:predicted dehydrogenase
MALRWGYLGAGGIADLIAADFAIAGLKIQAVATRDLARTNTFADKFNIPNRHADYLSLVADPEVDVVYISTVQTLHLEHALLAIRAGKHVLLEKPFTMNSADAQAIYDAAKAADVFVMEAMWTRFLPTMDAVFEVINSGLIGKPHYVYGDHSQFLPNERAPRLWNREQGGGAHFDLGIYPVSFAIRVLGFPDSVAGKSVMTDTGVDAATAAVMQYNDGSLAVINSCMTMAGTVAAAVHGTKGRLEIDGSFYEQTTFRVYDNDHKLNKSYDEKISGRGMQYQAIHLEECVAKGLKESPVMSLSDTVKIMQVMEQIHVF